MEVEFESTPFITPPNLDKSLLLQYPVMTLIWSRAAFYLKQARKIIFIGYSLPPTDYLAECLFRTQTRTRNCVITVVNPATGQTKLELVKRCQSIFEGRKIRFVSTDAAKFLYERLKQAKAG